VSDILSFPIFFHSDRPEKDGSYLIIHAFGANHSDIDDDATMPIVFSRKVIVTSDLVRGTKSKNYLLVPLLKSYGRVRLWN